MKAFGANELKTGNVQAYCSAYLKGIDDVNLLVKNREGVKTALKSADRTVIEDLLRASLVLSDYTTLTLTGGHKLTMKVQKPDEKMREVSIPTKFVRKYKIDPANPKMLLGVVQALDEAHLDLFKSCVPLIESERLLIRPERIVMVKVAEKKWNALNVEPDATDDRWIISDESQSRGEIPVRVETSSAVPLDIALPYLRGIPFSELVKILDDSKDTLLNLRRSIQEGIKHGTSEEHKTTLEFRRDTIDPQIETLERTFKKTIASTKYTMGAASLATVGLSLCAMLGGGATGMVTGLLGAGGLGVIAKEYGSFRTKLEEMKDNPYYLFWKAKRHR